MNYVYKMIIILHLQFSTADDVALEQKTPRLACPAPWVSRHHEPPPMPADPASQPALPAPAQGTKSKSVLPPALCRTPVSPKMKTVNDCAHVMSLVCLKP